MVSKSVLVILAIAALGVCRAHSAKLPDDDIRVGHDHKLSEQSHYVDSDNDKKMEHNVDYDHEAFLGKDEADKFKAMSVEESKEKLGSLVARIDKNHDGFVTQNELRNWIRLQHKTLNQKHTDKTWSKLNSNGDEHLSFDELIDNTIGALDTWSDEEKEKKKDDYKVYLKLMERDKTKFKAADIDADGKLSKLEFADFLHPEESIQMREIVISETIEDIDKNNDGVIDLDEYLGDIYRIKPDSDDETAKSESENFKTYRDKNGDNVLDREEVAAWILPTDYDHTLNEAKHLIYEADDDKDGKLTKKEILDNFNLFVSSRATSYGQAIYDKEDL